MIKKGFVLIGLIAMFLISAGCAGMKQSRLELDYGTSLKLARFNQILNPEAEKNLEPVYGFDGQAAKAAIEKYRKGFEEPAKEPVFTFGIAR